MEMTFSLLLSLLVLPMPGWVFHSCFIFLLWWLVTKASLQQWIAGSLKKGNMHPYTDHLGRGRQTSWETFNSACRETNEPFKYLELQIPIATSTYVSSCNFLLFSWSVAFSLSCSILSRSCSSIIFWFWLSIEKYTHNQIRGLLQISTFIHLVTYGIN